MKLIVSTLAAAALVASPLSAIAQGHGGGHGGMGGGRGGFGHSGIGHAGVGRGGFSRGGFGHAGFGGGGFRGGGFRGHGFGGRGFYPFFGFGLGFALAADPWFYGPYGWDYGPYAYGYYPYAYDAGGDYDDDDYDGPPPPSGAAPARPAACGQWVWHADQSRYQWVPGPCAAPAPVAQSAPPPPG
jgi:hypothetical protein